MLFEYPKENDGELELNVGDIVEFHKQVIYRLNIFNDCKPDFKISLLKIFPDSYTYILVTLLVIKIF